MAATGKTPILLYGSTTATNTPSAGNLTNSSDGCEIAINVADKNLFFKDSTNAVNTVPIRQSSASSNGWLSSTDWSTFNSKQPAGTYVTSVTGTAPVVSSGGTTPAISMAAANGSTDGYLSSTDWNTFNNKAPAFTYTSGYIPFGQGTTTPTQDSSLYWDNTNKKLSIGTTTPTSSALAGKVPDINVQKSGTSYSSLAARSFATTNAAGGMLVLGRSNSATLGTLTATTDGQNFGYIGFEGVNTSSAVSYPAYITAQEDGANGATYTPGRIMFYTGTAAAAPVEQLRIASTGDVTVKTGNLVIGTSGKGIDFSATSDGSGTATSELLADYEEGTWDPAFAPTSGAFGTVTYAFKNATYTKVGNTVRVNCAMRTTAFAVGTGTGTVIITGLPYTSGSTANAGVAVGYSTNFTTNQPSSGIIAASSTSIALYYRATANGGSTGLPVSDLQNGSNYNYIVLTAVYNV